MSNQPGNDPHVCWKRLENHAAEIDLAIKNLENPDYRRKIIHNLENEQFVQSWQALKTELIAVDDFLQLDDIACRIADRYEFLLNTINAPDCVSFMEWLQSVPFFQQAEAGKKIRKEQVEKQITVHYRELPHFQGVVEKLKAIGSRIRFSSIRETIIQIFVSDLVRTIKGREDENILKELSGLFQTIHTSLERADGMGWLSVHRDDFDQQFAYLQWPERSQLIGAAYEMLNQAPVLLDRTSLIAELEKRDHTYQCLHRQLETISKNPGPDFPGAGHVRKVWIESFPSADYHGLNWSTDDLKRWFDSLTNILDRVQTAVIQLNIFQQQLDQAIEKKLADIPVALQIPLQATLGRIKSLCNRSQKAPLDQTKTLGELTGWAEERNKKLSEIHKSNHDVMHLLQQEMKRELGLKKKNVFDLEKLGVASISEIRTGYRSCHEIFEKLERENDFFRFLKTSNTFYNQLQALTDQFRKEMQSKLNADDMEVLDQLHQARSLDLVALLREKHQSIQHLLEFGLIQVEIKPYER